MVSGSRGNQGDTWERGEVVLRVERFHGRLWSASPARIIDDADGWTTLFHAAGTRRVLPAGGRDSVLELKRRGNWTLIAGRPSTKNAVVIVRSGARIELRWVWDAGWRHEGWYVNLQTPVVRGPRQLETTDLVLDLWLRENGAEWKDVEDYDEAIHLGVVDADDGALARAEAERAVQDWHARRGPFARCWDAWRPPAAWLSLWDTDAALEGALDRLRSQG